MSDAQIRRALAQADSSRFERTALYKRVFALAEQMERRLLPRATMPRITLESPKITRKLTTEWFATRVETPTGAAWCGRTVADWEATG